MVGCRGFSRVPRSVFINAINFVVLNPIDFRYCGSRIRLLWLVMWGNAG
jgi:hypothetical protein